VSFVIQSNLLWKQYDIVIAVISREYIETLPNYILGNLGVHKVGETNLDRGEILIVDYGKKSWTKM